ncbi:MAG: hypothetical protein E6G22_05255, partial [Actinobacteria bacterium]
MGEARVLPFGGAPVVLAVAVAATAASLVALRSEGGAVPQALPSFLRSALGPSASAAPHLERLAGGATARIGRREFGVRARGGRVTLTPIGSTARGWSTFRDGVTRRTSFGHDTIVVGRRRVEELLTVSRRQGVRTWAWRIGAAGLVPRAGANGAVAFVAGHRLAPTSIAPVEILDAHGRRVTPAGLRWSLRRSGSGWWLELRLDDRRLPLPYVVDPSITFRASATATAGSVTSIAVPVPAGVAAGDVMLAQIAVRSTATITQGSWTSVVRTTNGTVAQEIFRRKATSSEPASYTFSISASSKATGAIAAYVGVDSSTSNGIDTSAANSGSSTSVAAPSVTTTRAGDMVAAFWALNTATTLPADGSTTQRWTLQSTGGGSKHTATAGDYAAASAGATGTKVATAGATGAWVADQVALYLDNTPPSAPNPTITESSADSYASGTAFYYRPGGAGSTFTVDTAVSDGQSGVKQVVFPTLAGGFTNTTPLTVTASPYRVTYSWPAVTGTESGSKTFTVTDNASGTATNTFSITSDSSVPTPATTFPGSGSYNATGWAGSSCGSAGFCGTTALDGGSGLQLVEISIRRNSTGLYWASGSFGSAAQAWQTATGTTSWSYAFPASSFSADGTYTITVRATDNVSNVATASSSTFTWDTTAPAAPTSLAVTPSSPANNNAPSVSGTAEAGSAVSLFINASCTSALAGSGTAAAFASPGLAVAVADDSSTTFYATTTDAAGNVSPCSSGVTYVEDSTAPAAPSALAVAPSSPANNNAPKVS